MENKEEVRTLRILETSDKYATQIVNEDDYTKIPDLIKMFKASIAKKEVLRIVKLTELLDKIEDRVSERFDNTDIITNTELLDFMKVTQSSIDRAGKMLSEIDGSGIPINNNGNTINVINIENKDDVSKDKIAKAVFAILNKAKETQVIDSEEIIVSDKEKEDTQTYTNKLEGED